MLTLGMFSLIVTALFAGVWWACQNDMDNAD